MNILLFTNTHLQCIHCFALLQVWPKRRVCCESEWKWYRNWSAHQLCLSSCLSLLGVDVQFLCTEYVDRKFRYGMHFVCTKRVHMVQSWCQVYVSVGEDEIDRDDWESRPTNRCYNKCVCYPPTSINSLQPTLILLHWINSSLLYLLRNRVHQDLANNTRR